MSLEKSSESKIFFLNSLCLDHSYITLDPPTFEGLLPLSTQLKGVEHIKTVSGDESWEGIYIKSRTGAYFEILRERIEGAVGVAISSARPYYVDAGKITEAYPEIAWKKGTRIFSDGQLWFDWYSSVDYKSVTETIFNPWVMKYYLSHRDSSVNEIKPLSIDRFKKLTLDLGSDHLDLVKNDSSWLPGSRTFGEKVVKLVIPEREGSSYEIAINLIPGNSRFKFKSLEMDIVRGEKLKNATLGSLFLEILGDVAVLQTC